MTKQSEELAILPLFCVSFDIGESPDSGPDDVDKVLDVADTLASKKAFGTEIDSGDHAGPPLYFTAYFEQLPDAEKFKRDITNYANKFKNVYLISRL